MKAMLKFFLLCFVIAAALSFFVNDETPTSTLPVDSETAELAVYEMEQRENITEATISQDGDTINLFLVLDKKIDPKKAQQHGANFVRLVKTLSQDKNPTKEIGPGAFNYFVRVQTDDLALALGTKSKDESSITW